MSTETPLNARRSDERFKNYLYALVASYPGREELLMSVAKEGYDLGRRAVLAEAERAHRWIPSEEGLPKKTGQYLCRILWHDGPDYEVCQFKRGAFWCYGDATNEVTHWKAFEPVG